MTDIEITEIPPLRPDEQSLLTMHSLLNVFNVLRGELGGIGQTLADRDDLLTCGLTACDQWIANLRDPAASLKDATHIDARIADVWEEIAAALAARPEFKGNAEIADSVANIHSVFEILKVRTRELLARLQDPDRWETFSIAALRGDLMATLAAMEKNSRGRFGFAYDAAKQRPNDYHIDFQVESRCGDNLVMPPVLQDVMRDLISNARKYTAPGRRIAVTLCVEPSGLRFVVEDPGCGIPANEIEKVVHFGKRASNVREVRTTGGGFGLTKAFLVTKQFGGRFWIASQLGTGTRVRISLPRPVTAGRHQSDCDRQPLEQPRFSPLAVIDN